MRRRSAMLILVAVVAAPQCTKAFAAIQLVATEVANPPGTPFLAPDAGLSAPWRSYQLSLQATAGELVGAVDVTINGPLHQRWNDSDFDGITDPTLNGPPSDGRGDSHLTAPAGSPFGVPASETNSKTGSPLTNTPGQREYGLGGLRGAWEIPNPTAVTNLAYIVISRDRDPELSFDISAKDPQGVEIFASQPNAVDADLGSRIRGTVINHTFTLRQDTAIWGNLQVTGPNGATPTNPPMLQPDGTFSWTSNIDDASLGQWMFRARATNFYGSDVATLTVNLVVPEPGTITMIALAMLGAAVLRPRRR